MKKTCEVCGNNIKCVDSDSRYCQIWNRKILDAHESGCDSNFFEKHKTEVYCIDCVNYIGGYEPITSKTISHFCKIKKNLVTNQPLLCSEIRGNMYLCGEGGKEFKNKKDEFDVTTGLPIDGAE